MRFNDPLKQMRETMKLLEVSDPLKQMRETMKLLEVSDSLKQMRESIKLFQVNDPLRQMRESLTESRENKIFSSVQQNQENLRNLQSALTGDNLFTLLETVSNHSKIFDEENREQGPAVNLDGSISISGSTVSQRQIETAVNQVFEKVAENYYDRFDQALNSVHLEIQKLKDSPTKRSFLWIMSLILTAVFASFINPLTKDFLTNYSFKDKKEFIKKFNKNVVNEVGEKIKLQRYRIVIADSLNVRKKNTKNSQKVGVIYFSQTVEVLRKKKNWTLVHWEDPQGESSIEGWVFSRYLKSFR